MEGGVERGEGQEGGRHTRLRYFFLSQKPAFGGILKLLRKMKMIKISKIKRYIVNEL